MELNILSALKESNPETRASVFSDSLNKANFQGNVISNLTGSNEAGMYLGLTLKGNSFGDVFNDLTSILRAAKQLNSSLYDGELIISTPQSKDLDKLVIVFEEFDGNINKGTLGRKTSRNINEVIFTVVFN